MTGCQTPPFRQSESEPPPAPTASAPPRFTLDGDDGLELHLEQTCARVVSGIRGLIPAGKLEAVLLGGGYGRGEGGVLRVAAGDRPYNDIEFYIAIRGSRHLNEARYHRRLEVLGEILTQLAGIEVEFKITSLAEIASRPVSMFSYDLASGHRPLWTAQSADLRALWQRHGKPEEIPLSEATRLLMNRCSGLLFARAKLEQEALSPADAAFVERNIAKAQLACGDALLTAFGRYHWSCRVRHERLADLTQSAQSVLFDAALRHHAAGVAFKLHPQHAEMRREALGAQLAEVSALARDCWLWVESRRLSVDFPSALAYARHPGVKCPESSTLMNVLLNLRAGGLRSRARVAILRHPRERAFNALSILLWEPEEQEPTARIGDAPYAEDASRSSRVEAYRRLWTRVQ
jgi:hypothetical protein